MRRSIATTIVSEDSDDYMVVSSRPVDQDLEFIEIAGRTPKVEYLRHDAAFARALARSIPAPEAPLRIYSGRDRRMTRVATDARIQERVQRIGRAEIEKGNSSHLPVAAFLGVLAALIVPGGPILSRAALSVAGLSAFWQVLHQCPTCPVTTIFGVPAGALGAILYGVIFLASLIVPDRSEIVFAATGLAGSAAMWQTWMQWQQGTACLPCGIVAFANLYVLTGAALGRSWRELPRSSARAALGSATVIGLGLTSSLATSPIPSVTGGTGLQVSNVRGRVVLLQVPITTLGLKPDAERPVIMIVAENCKACEEADTFFRAYPASGLRTVYLGQGPPGSETISRRDLIQATPTFLFFDAHGRVREERRGWSDSREWQRNLLGAFPTISAGNPAEEPSL